MDDVYRRVGRQADQVKGMPEYSPQIDNFAGVKYQLSGRREWENGENGAIRVRDDEDVMNCDN